MKSPLILWTSLLFFSLFLTACGSESQTPDDPEISYQYQLPATENDGWQVSHASDVGLNISLLEQLTKKLLNERSPVVDGIVVVKDEQLVFEHYFNGYSSSRLHELQSAVKSIDSALVGIAIDQGFLTDINQTIFPLLPNYQTLDWSNGKDQLTLAHLLTMRSGFPCRDGGSGDCNSHKLNQSHNWTYYTLSQAIQDTPGSTFSYFTGLNIVSHTIIENITNKTIDDFAMEHLFTPLGISKFTWSHSPSGEALSGNMLPRDMAKFGQLYLNNGQWQGVQVISSDWVTASVSEQVKAPLADGWGYGYWWWLTTTANGKFSYYSARGAKDQFIFVVPDQELVVVFTGNRDSGDAISYLERYILASFE